MKRHNELSLREALQLLLREYHLEERLKDERVRALWHERMGKTISAYTSNVRVRKGVLYLTLASAPLRQELSMLREQIRAQINEEMGEPYIREIVIR